MTVNTPPTKTSTPMPPSPTVSYLTSSRRAPLSGAVTIHGPSGSGKTRLALTASKFFPTDPAKNKEWVRLEDLVVIAVDPGGLDGYGAMKIDVPLVSLAEIIAGPELTDDEKKAKKVRKKVNAVDASFIALEHAEGALTPGSFLVPDTVSVQASLWAEHYGRMGYEKYDLFRALDQTHTRYFSRVLEVCARTGARPIFLSHSKARTFDSNAKNAADVAKTRAADATADIGLDVDGGGRSVYLHGSSLVMATKVTYSRGKPDLHEVSIDKSTGWEAKARFDFLKDMTLPFNLKAIYGLIDERMNS